MAYIGRQQDGFGVRSRFIYTATGGQTTFNTDDSGNALSYADGAYVDVYLNGVLLDPADYTDTSLTSIVLDSGATASDILEVIVYDVFSVFSGTFTNGITASDATVTGDLTISDKIVHSGDTNTNVRFPAADTVAIETAGSERMRIDSSGTLLVGKTAPDFDGGVFEAGTGGTFVSRSGTPFGVNRNSSDGQLANFYKDGTQVGTIGAVSGDVFFAGPDSNHAALRFAASSKTVLPVNNVGALSDNDTDLGQSNARFKDMYLGGGLYVGGTGSVNHLDDYEEGDWVPGIDGMTFSATDGVYTKIGKRVHCSGIISSCTSGTAAGVGAKITGLPFTVADSLTGTSLEDGGVMHYWINLGTTASLISIAPGGASTEAFMYRVAGSGADSVTSLLRTEVDASDFACRMFFSYVST